jgi:hypothetical protein
MPTVSLSDLGERREAVRRARRVRDDVVLLGVVLVEVDAQADRDVLALGRRGDDDLLRAAVEVLGGVLAVGEATGRLDDHVDAEVAPRQVRRVRLGEHLQLVAVDDEAVSGLLDVPGYGRGSSRT